MIALIAGGARSGKSRYALELAESFSDAPTFVATAKSADATADEDMQARIQLHQQERGDHWQLVEEPYDLAGTIANYHKGNVLLIDCLTLWVTNWLIAEDADGWKTAKESFLAALKVTEANVILVTNEVGMGVVPMGKLSRDFVDETGWLHQACAAIANQVTIVTFGIPSMIKNNL